MQVSRLGAVGLGANVLGAAGIGSIDRSVIRIADLGYSNTALGHGTRWTSDISVFAGRSNDPGHAADDVGTLTIYQNGTAKWAAAGDTAGALVAAGTGFVWLESGTAGRGFCFCIMPEHVSASSPTGTAHSLSILAGNPNGAIGYYSGTMFVWAQFLAGFRFDVTGILGIGGQKTAELLPRADNIFHVNSVGKALSAPPNIVHVSIGYADCLDIVNGVPGITRASMLANTTAIKDIILAGGAMCIFSTVSAETVSAGLRAEINAFHAHIFGLAAANPDRVKVANYASVIDDPMGVNGAAYANIMTGPHYNDSTGAYLAATVLNTLLDGVVGSRQGRSAYIGGRANLAEDGAFLGTGGSLSAATGASCTGTSAWDVSVGTGIGVDLGDASVVCSKETTTEAHPWQVFTVTGGTEDSYVIASTPITWTSGDLEGQCELYVSDASMTGGGLVGLRIVIMYYDVTDTLIDFLDGGLLACGVVPGVLNALLKTDAVTAPSGATSAKLGVMWWQPANNDVVIKLRNGGASVV